MNFRGTGPGYVDPNDMYQGYQSLPDGSYLNQWNNTVNRIRTDASGMPYINWKGKVSEVTYALSTQGHNPFYVYSDGNVLTDANQNPVYKSYEEYLHGSSNVVIDHATGAPVLDPSTGQVKTRSLFNMSIEKWAALAARMIGCGQIAEKISAVNNPVTLAASIRQGSVPSELFGSTEKFLKHTDNLRYDARLEKCFKNKSLLELFMPAASRQGPMWQWPLQRLKTSFQNFFYNNCNGSSLIRSSFSGMLVPVVASVSLIRAFCDGYARDSRNGGSMLGSLMSGGMSLGEEFARTFVSYKMADLAFYATRFALTRFGAAALLGGPMGIIAVSCASMAFSSVIGNQVMTGFANRLKYALKMGYAT